MRHAEIFSTKKKNKGGAWGHNTDTLIYIHGSMSDTKYRKEASHTRISTSAHHNRTGEGISKYTQINRDAKKKTERQESHTGQRRHTDKTRRQRASERESAHLVEMSVGQQLGHRSSLKSAGIFRISDERARGAFYFIVGIEREMQL
jgi:hypothetical protein